MEHKAFSWHILLLHIHKNKNYTEWLVFFSCLQAINLFYRSVHSLYFLVVAYALRANESDFGYL